MLLSRSSVLPRPRQRHSGTTKPQDFLRLRPWELQPKGQKGWAPPPQPRPPNPSHHFLCLGFWAGSVEVQEAGRGAVSLAQCPSGPISLDPRGPGWQTQGCLGRTANSSKDVRRVCLAQAPVPSAARTSHVPPPSHPLKQPLHLRSGEGHISVLVLSPSSPWGQAPCPTSAPYSPPSTVQPESSSQCPQGEP